LFNGQQNSTSHFTISSCESFYGNDDVTNAVIGEGNRLTISENKILDNLRALQMEQGLNVTSAMKFSDFPIETGTDKTFVFR